VFKRKKILIQTKNKEEEKLFCYLCILNLKNKEKMSQKDLYLPSKPRYEILDGLRGVAALMVIVFHCFETYIPRVGTQIINHGYLAVDFFFLLSGFVIGYAYDDRWNTMTVWGFFKRRLVRLHPMVMAGTLTGAALFFFAAGNYFPMIMQVEAWKFVLCIVLGLLMIPCSTGLDIRGWGETNPLNGPNWSLTFEYIGNILYALILRRLPTAMLAVLCLGSVFFTLDLTLGWDVFQLLPRGPQYTVIGGGEGYKLAMPYATTLELTHVQAHFQADTFFPEIDPQRWQCVRRDFHPQDERHAYDFYFETYKLL